MTQIELLAFLNERKRSYQLLFGKAVEQDAPAILDLKNYCFVNESTLLGRRTEPLDVYRSIAVAGRRDVWLRIHQHLTMTPEELAVLYGAVAPTKDTDNELETFTPHEYPARR